MVFSGEFLQWAIAFFILAIIAGAAGMQNVAGISMRVARIFVILFLLLAIIAFIL